MNTVQVAALIGNMMYESRERAPAGRGLDFLLPSSRERGGGTGFGIAQWTEVHRVAGLQAFSHDQHLPITDFGLQLAYVVLELDTGGLLHISAPGARYGAIQTLVTHNALSDIGATGQNREMAVETVENLYETPIPGSTVYRDIYTKEILRRFGHR